MPRKKKKFEKIKEIKKESGGKIPREEKEKPEKEPEEIQLDEKTLEALTETPDEPEEQFDNFSEFMLSSETSKEMPTMTLPTSLAPLSTDTLSTENETLEQAGERAPAMPGAATTAEPDTSQDYTPTIYNEPGYTAGISEEDMIEGIKEMRETRRFLPRAEMAREMHPTMMIDEPDELKEIREQQERAEGGIRDYVVEVERRDDEGGKLPFERKSEREYKERR